MKNQAYNPYLPCYEYVPDGEPRVFDDRVYIYGSHDCFDGDKFCMNDYVCWSAPIDDLGNWRYEGVIYQKTQEPSNTNGERNLYAPDVERGPDGRYYLYYSMMGTVTVAVCDIPAGKYQFLSYVQHPDGTQLGRRNGDNVNFDPAIFVDEDNRVYLYSGVVSDPEIRTMIKENGLLADGGYCIELEMDMFTVKNEAVLVVPAEGEDYEGHVFFEGSSLRKIYGRYYFVYSSRNGHELCYAVSDTPNGRFTYKGTLVSNGDIFLEGRSEKDAVNYTGNTHGGLLEINGHYYIFYHRQTNLHHFSRQGCAEEIYLAEDGNFSQAEMTSCGLNGGALRDAGTYDFYIACNLYSKDGAVFYPQQQMDAGIHPYFTQDKPDGNTGARQYIANFADGAVAGIKYFEFGGAGNIAIRFRGDVKGSLFVYDNSERSGEPIARINLEPVSDWAEKCAQLNTKKGKKALYFTYSGTGAADLLDFTLTPNNKEE